MIIVITIMCLGCGQDNESDTDYEDQNQEEGDDNYVCTLTEPQTAEQQDSDQRYDDNYKPPSPADPVKSPRHRRAANVQDSAYRGNKHIPNAPNNSAVHKEMRSYVKTHQCICCFSFHML